MTSEKKTSTSSDSNDSITITNINNNPTIEIDIDDPEVKSDEKDEKGGQRLGKLKLFLVTLGLLFGVFLSALDQTIVATSLPAIASDFNALDQISWVAAAYLLTSTGFQPTYGKLSDIFGRKETFLFAIIIFEIGSLLCGLASNMIAMIIARAIAGVGGGGIISLVMVIIADIVPLQDRGKYQGLIGAVYGVSSVVGALLGGAFTDHVTWRWSFYINLPLGAITIGVMVFLLHIPRTKGSLLQKLKRVDYLGTLTVVGATIALLLPLNWGGNQYPWSSPIIIVLLIVGCIGFILFAIIESKFAAEPVAPPHLFKQLHVVGCFSTIFFQGMPFYALIYYIPVYFQVVKGDSATKSGLELIPYVLGIVIASIGTGQFISRSDVFSYRTLSAIGAALITIGVGLITLWDENIGRAAQIGYMVIAGIGVGIIIQTTLLCSQGIVEYKDIATVTTLLMFFRLIGAVFGVTIVGTIFSNYLTINLEKVSISFDQIEAVKKSATLVHQLPEEIRGPIIAAYVNSLRSAFTALIPIGIICFICSLFMGSHRPKIRKDSDTIMIIE